MCKCDTREGVQLYAKIAIGTYLPENDREQELVGLVPIELSFLLCKFLAHDVCCLEFTPTGPRYLEDGLVDASKQLVKWKGIDLYFKDWIRKKSQQTETYEA